jgi:putative hydrolase of the HAD superfamily
MRWIVFDYGEVISRRSAELPAIAGLMGVPLEVMEPHYWALRDPYDRGWSDLEFWRELGVRCGAEVDPGQVPALTEADVNGWLTVDPAALELLAELDEAGYGLGLLSNAPMSHGEVFRRQPWAARFRHMVISGELGIAKPDQAIWEALVARLEAAPGECVFLDDKQVNVDGARAAGLHAHRWSNAAVAREEFARLGVL